MNTLENRQKKLILLFGATGRSGFHITNRLLESSEYALRVVVRNKSKITQLFGQRQKEFQSIIDGQIFDSKVLEKAFKPSSNLGEVKIVINALGLTQVFNQKRVIEIEATGAQKIIKFSKQNNVERYVLIGGAIMQKPWHPFAVLINTIMTNLYHHKATGQNYLRRSGLNYTIIQAPLLTGDVNDQQLTGYDIGQVTKNGSISRHTLSHVVLDSLNSKKIPENLTFYCEKNTSKEYRPEVFSVLKEDKKDIVIKSQHRIAKNTYWSVILLGTVLLGWFGFTKLSVNNQIVQ